VTKQMGSYKDSLIGKVKPAHVSKGNKEFIHHFPWAGRCSDISRKAGLHHMWWLLGKTNTITPKVPPFLLLPPTLYAQHDVIWHGISLWSIGVSSSSCVPSQLLVHPAPWCGDVRSRGGLDSV